MTSIHLSLSLLLRLRGHSTARIVYADDLDLDNSVNRTLIGINCRLCPREDCGQRASPPLDRHFAVTEHRCDLSPLRFAAD